MTERLQSIRPRLRELARRDHRCLLFGASTHGYYLAPPLQDNEVRTFELLHDVHLPDDYREFLLHVGSAGAGPYYGLNSLGNFGHAVERSDSLEEELEDWIGGAGLPPNFLSSPFPFDHNWSEPPRVEDLSEDEAEEQIEKWETEAWADTWVAGTLCIAEQGCNIRELLVVSGDERGHIWTDIRCDGGGVYPLRPNSERKASPPHLTYIPMFVKAETQRTTFLDWYEWWLDWSLKATTN